MTNTNLAVGDLIHQGGGNWEFNEEVARVFDDHVKKSVPCYDLIQSTVFELSDWFVGVDNPIVYDIGCATGATLCGLIRRHWYKPIQLIGIDCSYEMLISTSKQLTQVKAELEKNGIARYSTNLFCEDATKHRYSSSISLAVSLFTVQFIKPDARLELVRKIYANLMPRGAFLLVEKVVEDNSAIADIFKEMHWSFKLQHFKPEEIMGKAVSLRGRLIPFTIRENVQMLEAAGFSGVSEFFKWGNFAGFLAIK